MTVLFAVLLFLGVGVLAVIHAMWGLGYNWPEANEEALAGVLALVALWPFVLLGRDELPWVQAVTFSIAGVFVARGVAGYTPTWRGHFRDEPFATRNRRYYSPYCLLMGVGYLSLLAGEMERQ
jgi:hypothetical protein